MENKTKNEEKMLFVSDSKKFLLLMIKHLLIFHALVIAFRSCFYLKNASRFNDHRRISSVIIQLKRLAKTHVGSRFCIFSKQNDFLILEPLIKQRVARLPNRIFIILFVHIFPFLFDIFIIFHNYWLLLCSHLIYINIVSFDIFNLDNFTV